MRQTLRSRRPSHATVVAYLALFVALGGTGAWATHEVINSSDVVDESLRGVDIRGKDGTSTAAGINGTLTGADISGQPARPSVGQPFVQGSLTTFDIKDGTLGASDLAAGSVGDSELAAGVVNNSKLGADAVTGPKVLNDTLKGDDVDESSLVGVNADKLDGKDSTDWKVAEVIETFGPLPREGTYTSSGGTLLITASGSGYRSSETEGLIGMNVLVDGAARGFASTFTNERFSHKAFVSDYEVVTGLSAGPHTIRLQATQDGICGDPRIEEPADTCTTTDLFDFFQVSVIEIPS
jgi:hypothetical protein